MQEIIERNRISAPVSNSMQDIINRNRLSVPAETGEQVQKRVAAENGIDLNSPQRIGFGQSVVRSVASPFLEAWTDIGTIVKGAEGLGGYLGSSLAGDKKGRDAAIEKMKQGISENAAGKDYGYFGKAGITGGASTGDALKDVGNFALDTIGTGAQLAPYAFGSLGFAPASASLKSVLNAAGKTSAVIGGISSFGSSLRDENSITGGEQKRSFGNTIAQMTIGTALGYPTGVAVKGASIAATKALRGVQKYFRGVPDDTFARTIENPEAVHQKMEEIGDSKNPYHSTAENIVNKFKELRQKAAKAYTQATNIFELENPGRTFDLGYTVDDLNTALGPKKLPNSVETKGFGLTITQDPETPANLVVSVNEGMMGKGGWTSKQLENLTELVNDLFHSNNLSAKGLFAINKSIDTAYNAVPFNLDNSPTQYHAAVMSLSERASALRSAIMPPELSAANKLYSDYWDAYNKFGRYIFSTAFDVKPGTAETFIDRLVTSKNKGEFVALAKEAGKKIKMDILGEANLVKDALAFKNAPALHGNLLKEAIRIGLGSLAGYGIYKKNPALSILSIIGLLAASPKTSLEVIRASKNAPGAAIFGGVKAASDAIGPLLRTGAVQGAASIFNRK